MPADRPRFHYPADFAFAEACADPQVGEPRPSAEGGGPLSSGARAAGSPVVAKSLSVSRRLEEPGPIYVIHPLPNGRLTITPCVWDCDWPLGYIVATTDRAMADGFRRLLDAGRERTAP